MTSSQSNPELSDITNNTISEFDNEYLPSNRNVLRRLLYETQSNKLSISNAIKIVIKEVMSLWEEVTIKVKRIDKCQEKLKKLYDSYAEVRKFQNRKTKKVTEFLILMTDVFDISKDDIIKLIGSMDNSVKKDFLLKPIEIIKSKLLSFRIEKSSDEDTSDRDDIEMSNQSSPPKLAEPESDLDVIDQSEPQKSFQPEKELSEKLSQSAINDDEEVDEDINIVLDIVKGSKAEILSPQQSSSQETYSSSQSQSSGVVFKITGRNYESKADRGTINVMTPEVVAAFDKAKVSDRDAVFITALIANALEVDLDSLVLNRKSINIARAEIRKKEYEKMKLMLKDVSVAFLIVHWDGKLIPDDIACKKVDRLPILVTSDKFTKLINVPALQNQKASTIASAVYTALKDWGLVDLVNALICDTTNANLGTKGGAASILERQMDKDLLYLPCRHHIFELLLRGAYESKFPDHSGPEVPLFKRFRDNWHTFDLNSFENGLADLDTSLRNEVPYVIQNIKMFLKEKQPRSDYKELLQISLIFLGAGEDITFKKPGAIHHARWMAKAIYAIKIFLFRTAFKLKKTDQAKLYAVCKFIVFRYLHPWYTATSALSAPYNDLKLIKALIDFKEIDKSISDATLHKLRNHLWYLSPELSILSLFDTDVNISTKRKIVETLKNQPLDDEGDIVKKFDPSDEGIRALGDKSLDYFTNIQSMNLFKRFNLDNNFLNIDCTKWEEDPSYRETREKLRKLVVVNDCAERAVHLAEEYINTRSQDEDQKQYLLQFIDESRRNILTSSDKRKLVKRIKTDDQST